MAAYLITVIKIALLLVLTESVAVKAAIYRRDVGKVCPSGSSGNYPSCVCDNGSQFNQVHNVCPPKSLESLAGSCPSDSSGIFPNCVCQLGKVYDHHHSICLDIDRSKCPHRSVGTIPNCKCEEGYKLDHVHWYCRAWYLNDTNGGGYDVVPVQHCPVFHVWNGKTCEPIRCPNNRELLYPHCAESNYQRSYPTSCPPGTNYTIEKPYCHCPNDLDYTYPICHERCLENTYFDLKSKSCVKRPCPAGWIGDYYPHCSVASFQKCPEEFPGEWPNCNIYDEGPRLEELKRRHNRI